MPHLLQTNTQNTVKADKGMWELHQVTLTMLLHLVTDRLFSSRVLCPSLVTLCSHKSGRCAGELYYASHLWYPAFYTTPMASSALQHWTASPTKEGCHWQAGGENRKNIIVGQSSLISLIHHCYDWHPGSRCSWTCNQLISKVDGGITGSRLRWSILT